jgi:capsid protein
MRTVAFREIRHSYFFDGMPAIDPAKEANAQATRLKSHTTTLAYEYARQGRDWESELRQRAKEVNLMRELQLPLELAEPAATSKATTPDNPQEEEE